MKFLIDQNLSPLLARLLEPYAESSHHVEDVGLRHATDADIIAYAGARSLIIISQDDDFAALIATEGRSLPSVIQLRGVQAVAASDIATIIVNQLTEFAGPLRQGAIITITDQKYRIRSLPIR